MSMMPASTMATQSMPATWNVPAQQAAMQQPSADTILAPAIPKPPMMNLSVTGPDNSYSSTLPDPSKQYTFDPHYFQYEYVESGRYTAKTDQEGVIYTMEPEDYKYTFTQRGAQAPVDVQA